MKKEKPAISRKEFLSYSALIGVTAAIGSMTPILTACSGGSAKQSNTALKGYQTMYLPNLSADIASDGTPLKAGVVGCGGRGRGAAADFLRSAPNVTITALGDVFEDRVNNLRSNLKDNFKINISPDNCFVGFDSYQKVIDSGVDIVILTTPPAFRPDQFKYAVERGKHSFLEKPIAVDATGYRTIMAASKQADAKKLSVVTGTQRHHQRSYVESYKHVMEGAIGEITGGTVYCNQNMLWYRNKEKQWSNMEWMIRDWVNWAWLSGDHIVEQHVHNIDVFTWFSGLKPIKATAFGGRARRVTGDQYDHFSVDFEMENGIHMHSMCRQINGCSSNVSEFIQGTKGSWNSTDMTIRDLEGNITWQFDFKAEESNHQQTNPYVLEHINLVNHIRSGEPINQAKETAISNMAGIMGREAAYSGKTITWDKMCGSPQNTMPEKLELTDVDMSGYNVPIAGDTQKA